MKRLISQIFSKFSALTSKLAGHPLTFMVAVLFVITWAVTGPVFKYSNTWQLIINTATTTISFWMVFLIQNTQNRDSLAMHIKLDQIMIAIKEVDSEYVNLETLTIRELEDIKSKVLSENEPTQPLIS